MWYLLCFWYRKIDYPVIQRNFFFFGRLEKKLCLTALVLHAPYFLAKKQLTNKYFSIFEYRHNLWLYRAFPCHSYCCWSLISIISCLKLLQPIPASRMLFCALENETLNSGVSPSSPVKSRMLKMNLFLWFTLNKLETQNLFPLRCCLHSVDKKELHKW